MTYGVGNKGPGLGQEQKWGRVKPVNGIPTLHSDNIGISYIYYKHLKIYIYKQKTCITELVSFQRFIAT